MLLQPGYRERLRRKRKKRPRSTSGVLLNNTLNATTEISDCRSACPAVRPGHLAGRPDQVAGSADRASGHRPAAARVSAARPVGSDSDSVDSVSCYLRLPISPPNGITPAQRYRSGPQNAEKKCDFIVLLPRPAGGRAYNLGALTTAIPWIFTTMRARRDRNCVTPAYRRGRDRRAPARRGPYGWPGWRRRSRCGSPPP